MIKTSSLFITFADGNVDYREASNRLAKQAIKFDVFTKVIALCDSDFRKVDSEWSEVAEIYEKLNLFPYYYLGTKAWVVNGALNGIFGDFDLIFYADAGCEFLVNSWTKKELRHLLTTAYELGGVAEQLDYPEKQYSKKGLVNYFSLSEHDLNIGQIQATWSIWKNSVNSKAIAKEWVRLSHPYLNFWHNPEGLEIREQSHEYIDHRRDQSIFSILWKKSNYFVKQPYWEYGGKFGFVRGCSIPIHAIRNRTGISNIMWVQCTFFLGMSAKVLNELITYLRKLK